MRATTAIQSQKPCAASEDCLHTTCRSCGAPVRSSWQQLEDHPGTIKGFTSTRLCKKHHNRGKTNVLSDSEMAWLRTAHPHAYAFHQDRRDRGIPVEGLKLKGE